MRFANKHRRRVMEDLRDEGLEGRKLMAETSKELGRMYRKEDGGVTRGALRDDEKDREKVVRRKRSSKKKSRKSRKSRKKTKSRKRSRKKTTRRRR